MKLYEITKEFKEIEKLEDVPQEAILDTLEGVKGEFEEKAKAVISFILNQDIDIKALEDHKSVIDAKIKVIKNRNESLRSYLKTNMESCGITEISCPLFKAKIGKPSKVCVIHDSRMIPDEYFRVTKTVSKSQITKEIKAGGEVPGASLEDGQPRLTIK